LGGSVKGGAKKMIVMLDTCVFCSDINMNGTNFDLLSRWLKRGNQISVPKIIVDEVFSYYHKRINEIYRNYEKCQSDWKRLTNQDAPNQLDPQTVYDLYKHKFESFLNDNNCYPPTEYPNITHDAVVQRLLDNKKPFSFDGKNGYRDYLIWVCFIELCKNNLGASLHFVTMNTKDFSNKENSNILHDDLLCDLHTNEISQDSVSYWTSMDSFITQIVKPELLLPASNEIENKINALSTFKNVLMKELLIKVNGLDITKYDAVDKNENDDWKYVTIDRLIISEEYNYTIENAKAISNVEYLLSLNIRAICGLRYWNENPLFVLDIFPKEKHTISDYGVNEVAEFNFAVTTCLLTGV
jgi:hypothetical protein